MKDWIETYLPKHIAMPLLLLLGILVGIPTLPKDFGLSSHTLQTIQQLPLLKITAIAILGFLAISFCYILLYFEFIKKPNFKDYIFDPSDQCWRHKTKQVWLCASCKVDNIFSPLAFTDEGDMICPKCEKPAKNHKLKTMLTMARLFPSTKLEDFAKNK